MSDNTYEPKPTPPRAIKEPTFLELLRETNRGRYSASFNAKTGEITFTPKQICTNGDKVRSMSDEELANIICCQDNRQGDECFDSSCFECTLEWLKKEAE